MTEVVRAVDEIETAVGLGRTAAVMAAEQSSSAPHMRNKLQKNGAAVASAHPHRHLVPHRVPHNAYDCSQIPVI